MIIDKNDIAQGIRNGIIELVKSPHGDGTVCSIGDHWFYFGGQTAKEYGDPEQYMKDMRFRTVVNEIFSALEGIKGKDEKTIPDEWWYYRFYLNEQLMKKYNEAIKDILKSYKLEDELNWLVTDDVFLGILGGNSLLEKIEKRLKKDKKGEYRV